MGLGAKPQEKGVGRGSSGYAEATADRPKGTEPLPTPITHLISPS